MSLAWLFNSIKALINWKLANNDKWAEADIHPLNVGTRNGDGTHVYQKDASGNSIYEGFLDKLTGDGVTPGLSTQGYDYNDEDDLNQTGGRCAV
jgi:hypothetical protein